MYIATYTDTSSFNDITTAPTGSLSISCAGTLAGGICNTNSFTVTPSATGGGGMGAGAQMQFSEDDQQDWDSIGNYSSSPFTATITAADGLEYAQYMDRYHNWTAGISSVSLDATLAPTNLTATAGNALVKLSWDGGNSTGATSYKVERVSSSTAGYTTLSTITVTSSTTYTYTNTSLTNGTVYYYLVSAVNSNGNSKNSAQVSATPIATPANLIATAGNAQVSLTWTASAGAASYNVQRATSNSGPYSPVANPTTNSYTDTGLANDTTYYYVVSGVNSSGAGTNSSQASATPLAAPILTAVPNNAQVKLMWVGGTITGATSYKVLRASSSTGTYTTLSTITTTNTPTYTFTDTAVTNGDIYYYQVIAVNSTGSANSAQISVTPNIPPGVPANLTATAADTKVTLSWTASTGATSYYVQRATTSGGPYTSIANPTTHSFTDTSAAVNYYIPVTDGTTYYYVVSAANASGTSSNSSQVNATPLAMPSVTVTPSNGQVVLSWGACSGAASYTVARATSSGGSYAILASAMTKTSYTDTSVTDGDIYYYQITAVNSSGSVSVQVSATPLATPTGLTATAGDDQVALTWTAVTGATSYNVLRANTISGSYTLVSTPTGNSFTEINGPVGPFSQLIDGNTYYYVVSASKASGTSANSSQVSATPLATPIVTVKIGSGQVSLSWGACTGAVSYTVERAIISGGPYTTLISSTSSTSYTDSSLTNGYTYYYRVMSVNPSGTISTQVSATPLAAPTGLTAMPGDGQVLLTWTTTSGGSKSYYVGRSTTSGGPYTTIANPGIISYTDTGLSNGTTYYYVVSAANAGGTSANSAQASATPQHMPTCGATMASGECTSSGTIQTFIIGNTSDTKAQLEQLCAEKCETFTWSKCSAYRSADSLYNCVCSNGSPAYGSVTNFYASSCS